MLSKDALDGSVLAGSDQGNLGLVIMAGIIIVSLLLAAISYVCQKKSKQAPQLEDSEANGSLFTEELTAEINEPEKIDSLAPEDM